MDTLSDIFAYLFPGRIIRFIEDQISALSVAFLKLWG
jgi:hypothetical protein